GCDLDDKVKWAESACPRGMWGPGRNFAPGVVPLIYEVDDPDRTLPGVIDFLMPASTPTGDMTGIGDALSMGPVVQALSRKAQKDGRRVRFCAPSHRVDWCEFSSPGIEVDDLSNPDRMFGEVKYHSSDMQFIELDETAKLNGLNRHSWWANRFHLDYEEMMENYDYHITDEAIRQVLNIGQLQVARTRRQPIIVIAPHAHAPLRTWPMHHMVELAWIFKELKACVLIIGGPDLKAIETFPGLKFNGPNPDATAAIMSAADLVIANDSGMAHMGAFIKRPTIAICGPTDGRVVFEGYGSVDWMQSERECQGCLWYQQNGYKPWCNHGCEALHDIKPSAVIDKAREILSRGNVELRKGGAQ
ncbi:hypothetical protein LCGC14_2924060, partial [marine sediment metagenome]